MASNNLLIENYKIARGSVEHFDKILSDIRKIVCAFNGIFVSSALVFGVSVSEIRYVVSFILMIILAGANFLIWLIEKHYHRYLFVSAIIAEGIEKKLFENKLRRLTYQLRLARGDGVRPLHNFRSYDFLYIVPILASVFLNFLLPILAKFLPPRPYLPSGIGLWLVGASSVLLIIYILSILKIIAYNNLFEKGIKKRFKIK